MIQYISAYSIDLTSNHHCLLFIFLKTGFITACTNHMEIYSYGFSNKLPIYSVSNCHVHISLVSEKIDKA